MNPTLNPALGPFVTRVALGIVLLMHGVYLKLVVYTLPGTASFFASIGLPGWSAYLVFAIEAIAGVALIVGYRTRLAALAALPVLIGATWTHAASGWLFTNSGGGWEYPAFLAAAALAQFFAGPGAFALSHRAAAPAGAEA